MDAAVWLMCVMAIVLLALGYAYLAISGGWGLVTGNWALFWSGIGALSIGGIAVAILAANDRSMRLFLDVLKSDYDPWAIKRVGEAEGRWR